ncbi:hypothetical protein BpHYR1_042802, partial [Brachionus plicatilis]
QIASILQSLIRNTRDQKKTVLLIELLICENLETLTKFQPNFVLNIVQWINGVRTHKNRLDYCGFDSSTYHHIAELWYEEPYGSEFEIRAINSFAETVLFLLDEKPDSTLHLLTTTQANT